MNFDDTPQEAEFRATARQWVAANAPKEHEAELSKSSLGRIRLAKHLPISALIHHCVGAGKQDWEPG